MSAQKKKQKRTSAPVPPAAPPAPRSTPVAGARLFRFWPYALIVGSVAVLYLPVLIGQGWLWNDFPEQNFIYRLFAAVSLKQGIFPFWNPYVFSGMPFFADVQAAVLYPLNLLLTPFASADWLSPLLVEYQVILHIVLGGLFMFWLCRDLGCGRSAGVLGAVTFMFCGFLTAHIFHTNLVHTAVWFPLIVLLFKRMLEKTSLLYMALCALALAAAFMAGYPQLMLHMYYWLGAYFVFTLIMQWKEKKSNLRTVVLQTALFGALVALSVGMSSIQLLPTSELGQNSARPTMGFAESCEGSLHAFRWVTMLVPKFFGTPTTAFWGIGAGDIRPGVHYYWETAAYCGILPLLFAGAAIFLKRSPIVLFFSIMGLFSFVLATGDSTFFYHLAYVTLPGLDRFRVPGRFAFMLAFSVSTLAAFGLQELLHGTWRKQEKRRKLLLRCFVGVGATALVGALFVSAGGLKEYVVEFLLNAGVFGNNGQAITQSVERVVYPALVNSCWISALFMAAAAAVAALRLGGRTGVRFTAFAALAIAVVDALVYGYGFASSPGNPADMYAVTPAISEFRQELKTEFFRINSRDSKPGTTDLGGSHMVFQKNQGSVHQLFLMEGYNPLRLKREIAERDQHALDLLNVKYAIRADEATGGLALAPNPSYLPRARMVYKYRVITAEDSILPALRAQSFDHVGTAILEKQPPFSSCDSCPGIEGRASIKDYTLNGMSVEVETPRQGLLLLSEIHYPCWKASVDGKAAPLYRADYALRAIEVPAGKHVVSCYYEDPAFDKGRTISLISLCAMLGALGIGWRGRKKREG